MLEFEDICHILIGCPVTSTCRRLGSELPFYVPSEVKGLTSLPRLNPRNKTVDMVDYSLGKATLRRGHIRTSAPQNGRKPYKVLKAISNSPIPLSWYLVALIRGKVA